MSRLEKLPGSVLQPVRIAHVTTVDLSLKYLLFNQLRSLQEAGYEVTGISAAGPHVADLTQAGIRHIAVPMSRAINPVSDLVSLVRLFRIMRRERFTIVHTHNPKPGLLGQIAARVAGVPVIVNTVHGFYIHDHMHPVTRHFFITLEKVAALCSDHVLSQNTEDMAIALSTGICAPGKISHLGNGIDVDYFDPDTVLQAEIDKQRASLGLDMGTVVVGFVGRLAARRKGFTDFLAASRQVVQRLSADVRFLVVGTSDAGKADSVSPELAKDYGVFDRCIFVGHRPNSELPGLYSTMDVLVLPSLFEGVPRVLMEATAMRVPLVATDVKGNREVVENEYNGLLVPLGDVDALAAAILKILCDPDLARRMGEAGRQMALERFDERRVFERVKATYARLLEEKGLAAPADHV